MAAGSQVWHIAKDYILAGYSGTRSLVVECQWFSIAAIPLSHIRANHTPLGDSSSKQRLQDSRR
jgi:hypothetical protein